MPGVATHWIGRLSLRTKLLLPPITGMVALIVVAGAASYGLRQQRHTIAQINDLRFTRLQLVMEANSFTQESKNDLSRLLSRPDTPVNPVLARIPVDELLGKIRSVIATLEFLARQPQLAPQEKTAVDDAVISLRQYVGLVEKATGAVRTGEVGSFARLDSTFNLVSWDLVKLVEVERQLTGDAFRESEKNSERLAWWFSGLVLLAAGAALATAFVVTRYVRRTVGAIHTAATELTNGSLAHRAEILGDDEIGETARAFNFLVDELARRAQERFRLAMDQSPDALILIDRAEMKVLDANVTAARRAGMSREELLASGNWEGLAGTRRKELERMYDAVIATAPQTQVEEMELEGADGAFPAEVSRRAVRMEDRWIIVISSRDISDRKRADAELQRRLAELARSNEELARFAYVASHDLMEPLRMIASYTQLLARRYQGRLDPDADDFIGFIVDGAARMTSLLNDLLLYSRVGRERKLVDVALDDVLDGVLANLKMLIEETGATVVRGKLPVVRGNRNELTQLFQNLVGNGLKFHDGSRAPIVRVDWTEDADGWMFSVADNGIGIAPEYFDRIFVIFQRLHARDSYAGSGIGLSICKKIVESAGGRIWVESRPGEGAAFRFTWLRAPQDVVARQPASAAETE